MNYKVNISIDDVCPHPNSSTEVFQKCYKILEEIPDAKFTIFIPMAYFRTMPHPPESMCKSPMEVTLFPDFISEILALPDDKFEIGYHGVLHGIPGKSNNDEFKNLTYLEAKHRIDVMFRIAKASGLDKKMKNIFRPPAYRMSPEAIIAAREMGIEVLGLADDKMYKDVYQGEDEKKNDVVYFTSSPPIKDLKFKNNTEIVYHACNWDRNYLSMEKTRELIDFLKTEKEKIEYCFIGDLV